MAEGAVKSSNRDQAHQWQVGKLIYSFRLFETIGHKLYYSYSITNSMATEYIYSYRIMNTKLRKEKGIDSQISNIFIVARRMRENFI